MRGGPEEHMVMEARERERLITVQNAEDERMKFANLWKAKLFQHRGVTSTNSVSSEELTKACF